MANAGERSLVPIDVNNARTLNEMLTRLTDSDVDNIIERVTYSPDAQVFLSNLRRLIGNVVTHQQSTEISGEERIKQFAEINKLKYPELVKNFKEWKKNRLKLIENLKSSSQNLKRNCNIVSGVRMLTSVADIFFTYTQSKGYTGIPDIFMENASFIGVVAHIAEVALSKNIHHSVHEAIKEDQESFEKVVQWFKRTKELDRSIREFFPYGIDKNIAKKIHACSTFDKCQEVFIAAVVSNAKKNVKLFKDVDFLSKAEYFASSEAGQIWFQKELLEDDPIHFDASNSQLYVEVQDLYSDVKNLKEKMEKSEGDITKSTERSAMNEHILEALKLLQSKSKAKMTLNFLTILQVFTKEYPPEIKDLNKLLKNVSEELESIQTIVCLLRPSGSQMDPDLQK